MKLNNDPLKFFESRTRAVRSRLAVLEQDKLVARHPQIKAFIQEEINKTTDDYIERLYALARGQEDE